MLIVGVLLFMISTRFTLSKNNPREFDVQVREETTMKRTFYGSIHSDHVAVAFRFHDGICVQSIFLSADG
jgi:uncharacterized membrane protein